LTTTCFSVDCADPNENKNKIHVNMLANIKAFMVLTSYLISLSHVDRMAINNHPYSQIIG
jgi:hypothetical protein